MELKEALDVYLQTGAGALALIVLIWLIVYVIVRINPKLDSIKESNLVHSEILKNSTDAVKEVSRSNDNVANALTLLNHSFNTLTTLFDKHDARQEDVQRAVLDMKCKFDALSDLVMDSKESTSKTPTSNDNSQ